MNLSISFEEGKFKVLPYVIPIIFTIAVILASFIIHQPGEIDVIFYYNAGNEILNGDPSNVYISNSGIGWPITIAFLTDYVGDLFTVSKAIALISSVLILIITFFTIKNILGNSLSALIAQGFLAINPFLHLDTIVINNEMIPLLFVFLSVYFLSKKDSTRKYALIGLCLGVSFWFRYQALLILFGIAIYLLISNQSGIRITTKKIVIMTMIFLFVISPMLFYNYSVHGVLFDIDPSLYMEVYGSQEERELWGGDFVDKVSNNNKEGSWLEKAIFNEQYVKNLFQINSHTIFNLDLGINNFSPIPILQFSGIPIFLFTALYLFNLKKSKIGIILPVSVLLTSASILVFYNKIEDYYFALIILPVISLGILSIRRIEKKILPFLVIPVIFYAGLSLVPIHDPVNMFAILITLPMLTAIFCTRFISFLIEKTRIKTIIKRSNFIVVTIILIIIITNLGFSYKLENMVMYQDYDVGTITDEIQKIFEEKQSTTTKEITEISQLLANEPNITEKTIMTNTFSIQHYIKSNSVFSFFKEDISSKSIDEFLLRENWSSFDLMFSNHYSVPPDRKNLNQPIPDYLIYLQWNRFDETPWIVEELENNQGAKFEKIYQSEQTKTVVFKINYT